MGTEYKIVTEHPEVKRLFVDLGTVMGILLKWNLK
jgi:hypothetical protein